MEAKAEEGVITHPNASAAGEIINFSGQQPQPFRPLIEAGFQQIVSGTETHNVGAVGRGVSDPYFPKPDSSDKMNRTQ